MEKKIKKKKIDGKKNWINKNCALTLCQEKIRKKKNMLNVFFDSLHLKHDM